MTILPAAGDAELIKKLRLCAAVAQEERGQPDLADAFRQAADALAAANAREEQMLTALQNAREFIDASAFNVLTKDYFDAVTKELDETIAAQEKAR